MALRLFLAAALKGLVLAALACAVLHSQEKPAGTPSAADDIAALIEKLTKIEEAGIGYSPTHSGGGFMPLERARSGAFILGQRPPAESEVLRKLVERGAAAVPKLLAHLDDKRPIALAVKHGGFLGGMFFTDEYDFNARTTKKPSGVNRDWNDADGVDEEEHKVTVGDLSFVALGQIVNRDWSAVRYQPTGCIIVNSPSSSPALLKAIRAEWGGLTREKHKESLIRDFREPDYDGRRIEAARRLGYYYREALDTLAIEYLSAPYYDSQAGYRLRHEKLYPAADAAARKKLFDDFIAKGGKVARDGLLQELFHELDLQESDEKGQLAHFGPGPKPTYKARECLIELYGYAPKVRSEERPIAAKNDEYALTAFVKGIKPFATPKLDAAVRGLLDKLDEDDVAEACIYFLIGRDADPDIQRYVDRHLPRAKGDRRVVLERLRGCLGWTPLHVAASDYDETATLAALLARGGDVNARAADGRTPLHLAANGNYSAIQLLIDHKADLNAKDRQGRTPLELSLGIADATEMLLKAGAEPSNLHVACLAGRADLVKKFLAQDKSLATREADTEETPLHFTAQGGNAEIAEALIAAGADVNATNNDRSRLTPLHYAAIYGRAAVAEVLLKHGARRDAKNWEGKRPVDIARDGASVETLRVLQVPD